MMRSLLAAILTALVALPAWCADDFKMPLNLERLASRASESVDVTLDAPMLQLASRFLSNDDPDQVKVKRIVAKLKGVYVRSFEFDKEGQYSTSDVEGLRSQLKSPAWARIVGVKSIKGENTEIYLRRDGDQVAGLVIIDAEPKELTVVHIDGPIDPEEVSELGGHLGIPRWSGDKPFKYKYKDKADKQKDKYEDLER